MDQEENNKIQNVFGHKRYFWAIVILIIVGLFVFFIAPATVGHVVYDQKSFIREVENKLPEKEEITGVIPELDKADYDRRMHLLANNPPQPPPTVKKIKNEDGTTTEEIVPPTLRVDKWPVKTPYPKVGAILPFNRVIAYYGNLYSKKMGALGEYEEEEMLAKLSAEVEKWTLADPETPAIPALHYISMVAQKDPGKDGKYRAKMPDTEIDKILKMADKIDAVVFLDIQVGLSTIEEELPLFKKYLELPNVHLGLDPEFYMKGGERPGTVIGSMDAKEINFATDYLTQIIKEHNLPPKMLMVHRFTQKMVTNYQNIKTVPEVQVVMNMDGWGHHARKINTYKLFVLREPVQFAGFKIFYKNDLKEENARLLEPEDILKLNPIPIYIQYQ